MISDSTGKSNGVKPPFDIIELISKLSGNPFFIESIIFSVSKAASKDVKDFLFKKRRPLSPINFRPRGIIAEEFEVAKAKFYSKTAMMEILKKGEEEAIKALFSSPQSKSAYDMAVAKQEELTSGTIKLIEDFIKLQVRIDD